MMKRLVPAAFVAAFSLAAQAAPIAGQGTWETTLLARDLDGDNLVDAYYDTVQDITWMADADYAINNGWTPEGNNLYSTPTVGEWLAAVNAAGLYGLSVWRLPNYTTDSFDNEFYYPDTSRSEMAHLWYETLGNRPDCAGYPNPACAQTATELNTANFYNVSMGAYALARNGINEGNVAMFWFELGFQADIYTSNLWLVTDGDVGVSVVPVPAALWLFVSAIVGLGSLRRRA